MTATRKRQLIPGSETTIVRARRPLKRRAAANAFKPIAQRLNKTWVEDVAEVTPQAVTLWCQGKRLPDTLTMLNLARESDSVWRYICEQAGRLPPREFDDSKSIDDIVRASLARIQNVGG